MKKKLKNLDLRIQIGLAVAGVLAVGIAGYMFVVTPQYAAAAKLQKQIDAENTAIYHRRSLLKAGLHPPTIETADLFRLARAMPDREDMPGIILTLSQVAQAAGISFDLIEPVPDSALPTGSYSVERIHLLFNGDFYGLSDFLYRIRSLVAVRHGNLEASGRLFNTDTLTFNVQGNTFPQISAELFVDAYVYGGGATASATATTPTTTTSTTTTPTTTTSPTDSTIPDSNATAAGATG